MIQTFFSIYSVNVSSLIQTFRPVFTIVPLGAGVVDNAVSIRANDFEDALQYFSAVQAGADCLITRNLKDFGFAKLEVLDSKTFLGKYSQGV